MRAQSKLLYDGHKNVMVQVTGEILPLDNQDARRDFVAVDAAKLHGAPRGLRLDSVIWLIEEKAGLTLWWGEEFILPMESRNHVRLDRPLDSPPGWNGELVLKSAKLEIGPRMFMVILDLSKQ